MKVLQTPYTQDRMLVDALDSASNEKNTQLASPQSRDALVLHAISDDYGPVDTGSSPVTADRLLSEAVKKSRSGGGSAPVLEELHVDVNGEYMPEEGVDGFNYVNVNVPGSVLDTLNVTANGTYTPGSGYDGFDQVVVEVEQEWDSATFTGTLDAPFTWAELFELDNADKVYGIMTIDATAIGSDTVKVPLVAVVPSTGNIYFSVCEIPSTTVSDVNAVSIVIMVDVDNQTVLLSRANTMQQGVITDLSQYASTISTTTTFVYHIPSSDD